MDQAAQLEHRVVVLERDVEELKRTDALVLEDIAKINARLGEMATKADLSTAETRITTAFYEGLNGTLKDALSSVPAKYAARWTMVSAIWTAVGAIAATGAVVVAVIEVVHHLGG